LTKLVNVTKLEEKVFIVDQSLINLYRAFNSLFFQAIIDSLWRYTAGQPHNSIAIWQVGRIAPLLYTADRPYYVFFMRTTGRVLA